MALDALFRTCVSIYNPPDLFDIRQKLRHIGISCLSHFVRIRNLPFSTENLKSTGLKCKVCSELKPRFYRKSPETLIRATKHWERIIIDFKGSLIGKNRFIFLVVDEFNRFPFTSACLNRTSCTVNHWLGQFFCFFDYPQYAHNDCGFLFMSLDLKKYLF